MAAIFAIAMIVGTGVCHAEGDRIHQRGQAFRGAATVSVATLQVPEKAWKHYEKARVLALKHRAEKSARESGKALAIAPSFAAAHMLQASQQLLLKDFDGAIANVLAGRKSDPDAEWAGVILAGAYNGLHRYDDALTSIEGLQGSEADSWQAKYEQARAQIGLGDAEAALTLSAEAAELAPKGFSDARLVRANALILAHRWTEAKEYLNRYLAAPGPKPRRDQVLKALAMMARQGDEEPVKIASR